LIPRCHNLAIRASHCPAAFALLWHRLVLSGHLPGQSRQRELLQCRVIDVLFSLPAWLSTSTFS
ncbi:MAG: hypothetical protein AB8B70_10140, partial [Prochlorococcus sp.]